MEKTLKGQLNQFGVKLKKAYGQNFLTDCELLNNIVVQSGVTKNDVVLEIGCGAGALTSVLSNYAKKVVGYEIDTTLKPVLNEKLKDNKNVEIVFGDIMKFSLEDIENKLGEDYIMVANLPYYITTPIVMRFLENSKKIKGMVIMVQEEVADRFCSKESASDYGAITVAINLRGSAKKIIKVGREMFTPPPNVDSAVVKIDIDRNKNKDVDFMKVRDVVKVAFSSRRKMLVNNLMNFYKLSRADAEKVLINAELPLTVRGEQLSAEDYIRLSRAIKK